MKTAKLMCLALAFLVFAGCRPDKTQLGDGAFVEAVEIFVSPAGDDNAEGTREHPFATINRARDAVRRMRREGARQDVTVYLRGGTYRIDETIVFSLEDSAPQGAATSTVYAALPGEEPVISSAKRIAGWKKLKEASPDLPEAARGKVWVADVPQTKGGRWRFHTLYYGQTALPRARSVGFIPTAECPNPAQKFRWDDLDTLHFPAGSLKAWPNLDDVEIFIRPTHQWVVNYLPLASVDEKELIAKTAVPGTYQLGLLKGPMHAGRPCCWVENRIDFIDKPGEWAIDTHKGKLYLWPTTHTPQNIMAPTLRELIRVEGINTPESDRDRPVTGIVFKGLTFIHGDRDLWTRDTKGIQHDWEMFDKDNAALRFRGARDCGVYNCTFRNSGGTGIRCDLYCQDITISGNTFRGLGGTGILLCGYGPGTKDVNKNNRIINNDISRCGELYLHSPAVFIWQSGHNLVKNNRIHDLPYDAVVLSGVRPRFFGIHDPVKWLPDWPDFKNHRSLRENMRTVRWHEVGSPKTAAQARRFAHSRSNIVEDNELHNVMQTLGDGNAIYLSCAAEGNIIRRNLIYNSRRAVTEIRFDDDQEESYVRQNIIFGNGIKLKHTNYIENNFIVGGQIRIRPETAVGAVVQRNIIYSAPNKDFFYDMRANLLDLARPDYNLLYCSDPKKGETLLIKARQAGHEKNGLFADPMFVDLANGDLRLKSESPALKLGIKQIDTSKIGLLDDPAFPRLRKKEFKKAVDAEGSIDF